jgi:hypothetical protein
MQLEGSEKLFNQISPILGLFKKENYYQLMLKLAADLRVPYHEVFSGITVEQCLVNLAGIKIDQIGAKYYQSPNYSICFKLNIDNDADLKLFVDYYNTHFPGFILTAKPRGDSPGVEVNINTELLRDQVLPALAVHQQNITLNFQ